MTQILDENKELNFDTYVATIFRPAINGFESLGAFCTMIV